MEENFAIPKTTIQEPWPMVYSMTSIAVHFALLWAYLSLLFQADGTPLWLLVLNVDLFLDFSSPNNSNNSLEAVVFHLLWLYLTPIEFNQVELLENLNLFFLSRKNHHLCEHQEVD